MTSLSAEAPGLYVVLSGEQTGHTTDLARELAPALGLPLLARHTLQQALSVVLPPDDAAARDRLEVACVDALVALAADCGGGVLHGIGADTAALRSLDGHVVEVVCRGESGSASGGTWPTVTVDGSVPVDIHPVADEVVAAASRGEGGETSGAGAQWVVWRQDGDGQRLEVARRDSEAMARSVAAAMGAATVGDTFGVTRTPVEQAG